MRNRKHEVIVRDLPHEAGTLPMTITTVVVHRHVDGAREATANAHPDVALLSMITTIEATAADALHPETILHHLRGDMKETHTILEDRHPHLFEAMEIRTRETEIHTADQEARLDTATVAVAATAAMMIVDINQMSQNFWKELSANAMNQDHKGRAHCDSQKLAQYGFLLRLSLV